MIPCMKQRPASSMSNFWTDRTRTREANWRAIRRYVKLNYGDFSETLLDRLRRFLILKEPLLDVYEDEVDDAMFDLKLIKY